MCHEVLNIQECDVAPSRSGRRDPVCHRLLQWPLFEGRTTACSMEKGHGPCTRGVCVGGGGGAGTGEGGGVVEGAQVSADLRERRG